VFDEKEDKRVKSLRVSLVEVPPTSSEVNSNVDKEDSVGKAVERDPSDGEVVAEERDGYRENDEVRHE